MIGSRIYVLVPDVSRDLLELFHGGIDFPQGIVGLHVVCVGGGRGFETQFVRTASAVAIDVNHDGVLGHTKRGRRQFTRSPSGGAYARTVLVINTEVRRCRGVQIHGDCHIPIPRGYDVVIIIIVVRTRLALMPQVAGNGLEFLHMGLNFTYGVIGFRIVCESQFRYFKIHGIRTAARISLDAQNVGALLSASCRHRTRGVDERTLCKIGSIDPLNYQVGSQVARRFNGRCDVTVLVGFDQVVIVVVGAEEFGKLTGVTEVSLNVLSFTEYLEGLFPGIVGFLVVRDVVRAVGGHDRIVAVGAVSLNRDVVQVGGETIGGHASFFLEKG